MKKILIVEDEFIIARHVSQVLEMKGFAVMDIVNTGEEAVNFVNSNVPDLIIMDIILSGEIDGISAIKIIQEKHDIPFVYLTAHSDDLTLSRAKETMPYGYILKPINENELYSTVEIAVSKYEMEKEMNSSKVMFEALFENSINAIAIYKAVDDGDDFVFINFNKSAEKIENIQRKDIIGKKVSEVFPGVKEFGIFEVFKQVWETGESRHHPVSFYKDKRLTGWRDNFVYKLPSGEIVAIYSDETEKKQAEERVLVQNQELAAMNEELEAANEELNATLEEMEATNEELIDTQNELLAMNTELERKEGSYRALVDNLPDIVMRFDRNCRHLFVSGSVENIVSIKAGDFIGKTHRELGFDEAQSSFWEEKIQLVFESGKSFETEFDFHGDNDNFIFNWRIIPEFDMKGDVVSVLSLSRDITKQREIEQDYRMLFNEMMAGFAVHEIITDDSGRPVDYRFLTVNPAFEELTSLKKEDIVGKTVLEVLPGIEQYWIDLYGKVALTGEAVRFEQYTREMDRHFEVSSFSPKKNQFACIFQDITERIKSTQLLKINEEKLAGILGSLNDIICMVDKNNIVVWASDVAKNNFGQDIVGRKCHEVYLGEDSECGMCVVEDTMCDGNSHEGECEVTTVSGSKKYFWNVASVAARDDDGRPKLVVIVSRDITDRKKSELMIKSSLEEKDIMLKEIHHRVKNNMQVIISLLNLQVDRIGNLEDRELITKVQNSVRSMALVHDKLYRTDNFASIDMHDYIKDLLSQIARSFFDQIENIHISVNVKDVNLSIDQAIPCGLIFNELITNSIKYAFPGGNEGNIIIDFTLNGDGRYLLSVADDGIGIHKKENPDEKGALGLELVRALTQQLDGEMTLDDSAGTTVKIEF